MNKEFYKAQIVGAFLHYTFKILTVLASALSIYLGYDLFIQGVTGEASIVLNANNIEGQLMNAAPGLFFAVGGTISLIIVVRKGVKVFIPYPDSSGGE